MYLKKQDFNKKYITTPINKIGIGNKYISPENLILPVNSLIHYIGDTDQTVGIDISHCLLRHTTGALYIYHELTLAHKIGTVSSNRFTPIQLIRGYHRSHPFIKPLSNLDRSLSSNQDAIVINYSILPRLYKYNANSLVLYQEWFNIKNTMWEKIKQIGDRREHFIRYKLPDVIPSRSELNKFLSQFNTSGLSDFHSNENFDILELWRIISSKSDSPITGLDESVLEHINLVFIESGKMVILNLGDLVSWSIDDNDACSTGVYKFLDSLVSLRNPIDTEALEKETEGLSDKPKDSRIVELIKAEREQGNISEAEQRGLIKLSQKHTTILDPKGSGKTLDKLTVTKEEARLSKTETIKKSDYINNTTCAVDDMDQKYIKDMLHKDIVRSVLMLHNTGIIVKDLSVKENKDAASKEDIYSIQLQPLTGTASTIKFTIPRLNPDGTFLIGGTLYRLDKQKGDLPIIKTKANTVLLTSYYGRLYVTRNESAVSNYSRWILKDLTARANDKDDRSVTDLAYGVSNVNESKIPRAYTAICYKLDSFVVNKTETNNVKYKLFFNFNYNKINNLFTDKEIEETNKVDRIPVGRDLSNKHVLSMDIDGLIYDGKEELGTLAYIVDASALGDGPVEYTELEIFSKKMPLILVFCYMYGLDKTLHMLNLPFTLHATNTRIPYNHKTYSVKFKDIIYLIEVDSIEKKLLVGGFTALRNDINKFKGSDLNKQSSYTAILSKLSISNHHLREIKQLWDLFVEPITQHILEEYQQPTKFEDILLYANKMLINDFIPDVNTSRYKGYERLCAMMYKELMTSVRTYKAQGSMSDVGVTMNPMAVKLTILQDQSQALVEQSNPLQNIKEHRSFTHVGQGGRSALTMVKETRAFTKHDIGVISESSPDSSKVGIRAYLSSDPNFTSAYGTVKEFDHSKDTVANAFSDTALISPSWNKDDAKRINV